MPEILLTPQPKAPPETNTMSFFDDLATAVVVKLAQNILGVSDTAHRPPHHPHPPRHSFPTVSHSFPTHFPTPQSIQANNRERRRQEAMDEFDDTLSSNLRIFERQHALSVSHVLSANTCTFLNYANDIVNQNAAVKQAVLAQGAKAQAQELQRQQDRLKRLDDAIDAIHKVLDNPA